MQSEPESESEPSSSPNFLCNGAASAAAAVSSRLPIDNGEEMIIKTEEIPSSSTKNITSVNVKKEEEEVVDDEGNGYNDGASASARNMNHDLNSSVKKEEENDNDAHDEGNNQNDGTGASASASNMNYGLNRSVKKEEENDNDAPNDDGDYDYSDWKTGNWCLLLPATDNSKNRQEQPGGDGAIAVTTKTDVTLTTTGYSSSGTKRSASQLRYINDVINVCETAAAAGPDVDLPPNKKMRRKENSTDKDDNSNIRIAATNHDTDNNVDNNVDIGIDIKEKVEEGSSEQHNINATVDGNDNTNTDYSSINSKNDNNSDDDDGYESWTEGNWCLLLSPIVDGNDDTTKNNSSSKLSVNAKTTNTCKRRRISRHRSCGVSPIYLEVDSIDKDEDDTVYDGDEDDTPMGDDDDNDGPTKRTKGTITHTKRQEKIWNEMLQKLDSYKKKHKSTTVPLSIKEDPKLGKWVHRQRAYYNRKTLPIDRINHLESIGFVWNPYDVQWMEMYQKLVADKKQYRSTKMPRGHAEDPQLGLWSHTQRRYYKKNKLTDKRTVLLESIGFVWDPFDRKWMEMYNRLVAYKKQYKHTNVPRIYPADPQLGRWIDYNRYRKNKLTEKRIELLNSIKFSW